MKNILIFAAENSAEHYGAEIIERFHQSDHAVSFFGAGGDEFREKGVDLVVHSRELNIVGIVEVLSSIPRLKRIMGKIVQAAVKRKADAAILIDYPDFNLRLAGKLKRAGIPVYYYISPTVWAWRYSRIGKIRKYVDHMFIIFPFEQEIYRKENIPYTYTGHPLIPSIRVTEDRMRFRRSQNIPGDKIVVTLLPGSRMSEVNSLLPVMLETMRLLRKKIDFTVFILKADNIDESVVRKILEQSGIEARVTGQKERYNLFSASDAALASCGTSNLELGVCALPFAAVYRVNRLSYLLGRGFLKISLYSIVNILLGREVVPEFIQKDLTPEKCAAALNGLITREDKSEEQKKAFRKLRKELTTEIPPSDIIFEKLESLIFGTK